MVYAVGAALWSVIGFIAGIVYAVRYSRYCAHIAVDEMDVYHVMQQHEERVLRNCDKCRNWHRGVVYGQFSVARTLLALLILTFCGPFALMSISQYRIELRKRKQESPASINATE